MSARQRGETSSDDEIRINPNTVLYRGDRLTTSDTNFGHAISDSENRPKDTRPLDESPIHSVSHNYNLRSRSQANVANINRTEHFGDSLGQIATNYPSQQTNPLNPTDPHMRYRGSLLDDDIGLDPTGCLFPHSPVARRSPDSVPGTHTHSQSINDNAPVHIPLAMGRLDESRANWHDFHQGEDDPLETFSMDKFFDRTRMNEVIQSQPIDCNVPNSVEALFRTYRSLPSVRGAYGRDSLQSQRETHLTSSRHVDTGQGYHLEPIVECHYNPFDVNSRQTRLEASCNVTHSGRNFPTPLQPHLENLNINPGLFPSYYPVNVTTFQTGGLTTQRGIGDPYAPRSTDTRRTNLANSYTDRWDVCRESEHGSGLQTGVVDRHTQLEGPVYSDSNRLPSYQNATVEGAGPFCYNILRSLFGLLLTGLLYKKTQPIKRALIKTL